VPPRIERMLRAFARAHPEEAYAVGKSLKFRQAVGRELEALVREGVPVADVPEVEESEPGVAEEAIADPQT
jgi:hypothetical protein